MRQKGQPKKLRKKSAREVKRDRKHTKKNSNELFFELGKIRKNWQQMLRKVEIQNELNPHIIVENIQAQTYLTDQLASIEETIYWVKECKGKPPRDELAGRVRIHRDEQSKLLSKVSDAQSIQEA